MRYGGCFEISFEQFSKNIQIIDKETFNSKIMLMIKANAYGHGILPITAFAYKELTITSFGCATLAEAIYIRKSIKGKYDLYVFSETSFLDQSKRSLYLDFNIIPVFSNLIDLNLVLSLPEFRFLPLVLKFNTGMNRLGLELEDVDDIISKLKSSGRSIRHLMTHLACSNLIKSNSHNVRQLKNFETVKNMFKQAGLEFEHSSVANSGAIEQKMALDNSFIRPGLLAYGQSSLLNNEFQQIKWTGALIGTLKAKILNICEIKKGTPIGYGGNPCPASGKMAILALGYGDGFSCNYQGTEFTFDGKLGKIVGRVSMDMCQVLFSHNVNFKKDQWIELWGATTKNFDGFCRRGKKIPYEAFCSLSPRLPRRYIN